MLTFAVTLVKTAPDGFPRTKYNVMERKLYFIADVRSLSILTNAFESKAVLLHKYPVETYEKVVYIDASDPCFKDLWKNRDKTRAYIACYEDRRGRDWELLIFADNYKAGLKDARRQQKDMGKLWNFHRAR